MNVLNKTIILYFLLCSTSGIAGEIILCGFQRFENPTNIGLSTVVREIYSCIDNTQDIERISSLCEDQAFKEQDQFISINPYVMELYAFNDQLEQVGQYGITEEHISFWRFVGNNYAQEISGIMRDGNAVSEVLGYVLASYDKCPFLAYADLSVEFVIMTNDRRRMNFKSYLSSAYSNIVQEASGEDVQYWHKVLKTKNGNGVKKGSKRGQSYEMMYWD